MEKLEQKLVKLIEYKQKDALLNLILRFNRTSGKRSRI